MKFCNEIFVKNTMEKYAHYGKPYPAFSYATVRDFCDSWDNLNPLSQHGDLKNVQRPWALKAVLSQVSPGGKILEFGGGEPLIAATLARMGYDVTIVDPYDGTGNGPREYERYVKEFPEVRLIRDYFKPSMAELSGEQGSFDAVYSISVIEHVPLPEMRDVFAAMRYYLKPTGYSLHAIDFIHKGNGDDEHKEMLSELSKLSGVPQDEVNQVLHRMDEDIETYYLSAEAHNAWRMGLTYDQFPMRVCVSLQLCTPALKIVHSTQKRECRGGIELICKEYVNGYCFDVNAQNEPVCLRVLMDEIELGRTWAGLKNIKYFNLGIGNGQCGFYYRFTESSQDLDLSRIRVVPVDDTLPLKFIHTMKSVQNRTVDIYSSLTEETAARAARLNDIFIVNHIPKTAGTSLRSSLEKQFSEEQSLYHYFSVGACSPEIWNWKFSEKPGVKFEDVVKIIMERPIRLVIGHFGFPEKYGFSKLLETFPLAKSIVFFREPRNHICSLYLFACKFFAESKSFEEYIEQAYTRNYQTNALCGISIDQLSFAGIVEFYNESLDALYKTLGFKLDYVRVNINQGNSHGGYDYSLFGNEKVWARFEELNQADIELYQQAKKRLKDHIGQINSNSSHDDFTWAKSLSKIEWAKALSIGRGPNGEVLPSSPPDDVQARFVGSSGYDTYLEAISFIDKMKNILAKNGLELRKDVLTLDCGVGWGRLYRAMLREVASESMLGIDIDSDAIEMCKRSMPYGRFEVISKKPPYNNLHEASFDLVYLYSVFSHLSEAGFRSMIREFSRIIKTGGFLVFTTLKLAHLNVWDSRVNSNAYGPVLRDVGFELKQWQYSADCGNFLFVPTGGGDPSRPADYYGEAIITEEYLNSVKASFGFELKTFEVPNDMPQTFVVMQKL